MELPKFKYHPNPIATGSIEKSDVTCVCCGEARGYIYTGPVYSEEELNSCLCPWCIANGSAHQEFDATFTDDLGVGRDSSWDSVSTEIIIEVTQHTPGFSGWQQEQWWTHCNDAAAFLGTAGYAELLHFGDEVLQHFREMFRLHTTISDEKIDDYFKNFHREHGPTAYVFRCLHCGKLGGYWDCH